MNDSILAQKIKEQFEQGFGHPFPNADVRKLKSVDSNNLDQLHGELDLYFSSIAGYATSADRLARRPRSELIAAMKYLSLPFFEKHHSLAIYRDAITQDSTPNLFRKLAVADKLREELLVLIKGIV